MEVGKRWGKLCRGLCVCSFSLKIVVVYFVKAAAETEGLLGF